MGERQAATINLAGAGDVAAILDWSGRARRWVMGDPLTARRLRQAMTDRDTNVIVAKDSFGIAALGIMHYDDDYAQLLNLSLDAEREDPGAAGAIVRWFETTALAAGIGIVSVVAFNADDRACAFFARSGYREFGNDEPADDDDPAGADAEGDAGIPAATTFAKDLWA